MPTVRIEYHKIKNAQDRCLRISVDQIFTEYSDSDFNSIEVEKRAKYFNKSHNKKENAYYDCMIAAEAEFLSDTTILLSYDINFINIVSPLTNGLLIIKPTEFINQFDISKNGLLIAPSEKHHLYTETWWKL